MLSKNHMPRMGCTTKLVGSGSAVDGTGDGGGTTVGGLYLGAKVDCGVTAIMVMDPIVGDAVGIGGIGVTVAAGGYVGCGQ